LIFLFFIKLNYLPPSSSFKTEEQFSFNFDLIKEFELLNDFSFISFLLLSSSKTTLFEK
jgi:hypothetical protein